jgi:hypothetical protein
MVGITNKRKRKANIMVKVQLYQSKIALLVEEDNFYHSVIVCYEFPSFDSFSSFLESEDNEDILKSVLNLNPTNISIYSSRFVSEFYQWLYQTSVTDIECQCCNYFTITALPICFNDSVDCFKYQCLHCGNSYYDF